MSGRALPICAGIALVASMAAPGAVSAAWTGRGFGPEGAAGLALGEGGTAWILATNASTDPDERGAPLAIQPQSRPFSAVPDPEAIGAGAIASDAPGQAIVAWIGRPAGGASVSVATFTGAGWIGRVELDRSTAGRDDELAALALAAGPARSVAVWLSRPDGDSAVAIRASWRDGPAATWTPAVTIATGARARAPRVGVNAAGDALVAWAEGTARGRVRASSLASGTQTWSPPRTISGSGPAGPPALSVGEAGDALVAWTRLGHPGVLASVGRLPGRLGAGRLVSAGGSRVGVAVGASGDAAITIARGRGFLVATRARRGRIGAPRRIPAAKGAVGVIRGNPLPAVVIRRSGAMTAIWARDLAGETPYDGTLALTIRRGRGGPWSRPRRAFEIFQGCGNCSPEVDPMTVAGDAEGHIAIVVPWRDVNLNGDPRTRIQLHRYAP